MASVASLSTLERDTKVKYLLVTDGATYFPSLLRPELERAGLYNWPKSFDGDVELLKRFEGKGSALDRYDIIHVNLAGGDFGVASKVRELIGDEAHAKLVVNMDYSVHYFPKAFKGNMNGMNTYLQDLIAADMVFGVEPKQVALMNYFMKILKKDEKTKRSAKAALLPHPINLELLSRPMPEGMFAPYDNRGDVLAYQYHRYDGHWEIAKMLTHNLPPPSEVGQVLVACLGFTDPAFVTADMPELVMPFTAWAKYIYFLSTCLWGFEYRTHAAASRFIMEAGALGIPVVSTDYSYLGKVVFPELCFPMDDYDGIRSALERLITDDNYRVKQARKGMEALNPYSFSNAIPRFMHEVEIRCP
jgi:hypothetical protein